MEYTKKVIHIRDRADTKARIRGEVVHIKSKGSPVTKPWTKTLGVHHVQKLSNKVCCWTKLSARQKIRTRVSITFTRNMATPARDVSSSCLGEFKERSKSDSFIRVAIMSNSAESCHARTLDIQSRDTGFLCRCYVDHEALIDRAHQSQDCDESGQHMKFTQTLYQLVREHFHAGVKPIGKKNKRDVKNGRCSQIIENSKIGVSRHLDSSTTTQMA